MLARLVRALPDENGDFVFEPKWDGFRCLASRDGEGTRLLSRHGRPLARYFPELVAAFERLERTRWTIDGEVLVTVDGRFDFEAYDFSGGGRDAEDDSYLCAFPRSLHGVCRGGVQRRR